MLSGGVIDYEYSLTDHLGNTRFSFDTHVSTPTPTQQDDYYAFGYEISRGSTTSPKNEYLYNKKELQEDLQEYDYGARFYDPVIGRWNVVDKKADDVSQISISPYAYVGDDPILHTDPDGNCPGPPCEVPANKKKPTSQKPAPKKELTGLARLASHGGLGGIDPTPAVKSLSPKIEAKVSVGLQAGIKTPIATVNFAPAAVDVLKFNGEINEKNSTATGTFFNTTTDLKTGKTSQQTPEMNSTLGVSALQTGVEVGGSQKMQAYSPDYDAHAQGSLLGFTQTVQTNQNNQTKTSGSYQLDFGASFIIGVELKITFGGR